MQGLLVVDKPAGPTSHDIVAHIRSALARAKVGHTGTLDPAATGVLVLAIGAATRVCQYLEGDKEYAATVLFGVETDTLDATGKVVARSPCRPTEIGEVREACAGLVGEIDQTPPMYSAVRVQGVRLHRLAREGVQVARKARTVTISELSVVSYEPPRARLNVRCSAGTYVRVIADDLGKRLGCGACLESLRRTRVGPFGVESAVSVSEALSAAEAGTLAHMLIPVSDALSHLPKLVLTQELIRAVTHGQRLGATGGLLVQLCTDDGEMLGIGKTGAVKPVTMLHPESEQR